jgi:hypothetical protein
MSFIFKLFVLISIATIVSTAPQYAVDSKHQDSQLERNDHESDVEERSDLNIQNNQGKAYVFNICIAFFGCKNDEGDYDQQEDTNDPEFGSNSNQPDDAKF